MFPAEAWHWDRPHLQGLGAALTIAIYDYLGYYNVCHLGDEVRAPQRTIPRAVMLSVLLVALLMVPFLAQAQDFIGGRAAVFLRFVVERW